MTCQAVWYTFDTDTAGVLGGRLVALACTAPKMRGSPWQSATYCAAHQRQLALAAEAGIRVPDPPPPEPAAKSEQASLL